MERGQKAFVSFARAYKEHKYLVPSLVSYVNAPSLLLRRLLCSLTCLCEFSASCRRCNYLFMFNKLPFAEVAEGFGLLYVSLDSVDCSESPVVTASNQQIRNHEAVTA